MKNPENSLQKTRRAKHIVLIGIIVFAGLLFVYSISREDPEQEKVEELKTSILELLDDGNKNASQLANDTINRGLGKRKISREALREIHKQVKKLSPETRKRLVREIMRYRLNKLREKSKNMTRKEKNELVQDMVEKVRERFANMDDKEREKTRNRMESDKGQEDAEDALDFYYNEFSAQERQDFDPVVNEIMNNLNAL
jgi:uncharacterized protein (UPF0305 family)